MDKHSVTVPGKLLPAPLRHRMTWIAVMIAVAVAAATGLEIWLDYKQTEKHAYASVTGIARVIERQTRDTVTHADQTLNAVSTLVQTAGGIDAVRKREHWETLRSHCTTLMGCNIISINDAAGRVKVTSISTKMPDTDVSDRYYFRQALEKRSRTIGAALVTRQPHSPILFHISSPLFDARGRAIGVVSIGMETDRLTDFFALFDFSLSPAITIYKGNGDIVARNPDMAVHVGKNNAENPVFTTHLKNAPAGAFESFSLLDGKTRLVGYRALPDLDLVIFSGIEVPVAFSDWKRRSLRTLTIVGVMLVSILGTMGFAYRMSSRQAKLKKKNIYLDRLTTVDELTGIGNRRLYEKALKREWLRHRRQGMPLSVLLVDIDCFKSFNDHYGHQAGDQCLARVAAALKGCLLREGDVLARYGGEEFVAILRCKNEGARRIAERMRRQVEGLAIPHARAQENSCVTISIGIADAGSLAAASAEELIAAADRALYRAKASGKNRACLAELDSAHQDR